MRYGAGTMAGPMPGTPVSGGHIDAGRSAARQFDLELAQDKGRGFLDCCLRPSRLYRQLPPDIDEALEGE